MDQFPELKKCIETVFKLRDPKDGCPWDLNQTHETLTKYLVEETYEFLDSVQRNDSEDMKDELGDVLLQVLLHSKIAEQNNKFTLEDVARNLKEKIIERHPHVFSSEPKFQNLSSDEVEENWQKIKSSKKEKDLTFSNKDLNFPALFSAAKIGKKTKKLNFDWEDHSQVLYKVEEEWQELKEELTPNRPIDQKRAEEEMGDLLFSMAQLARHLNLDPEETLRSANKKFISRFNEMEKIIIGEGRKLTDFSQEELDQYWSRVKSRE